MSGSATGARSKLMAEYMKTMQDGMQMMGSMSGMHGVTSKPSVSAYTAKAPHRLADSAGTDDDVAINNFFEKAVMKILGWIILVIFLIGLAVVLGLGKLIF